MSPEDAKIVLAKDGKWAKEEVRWTAGRGLGPREGGARGGLCIRGDRNGSPVMNSWDPTPTTRMNGRKGARTEAENT